MAKSHHEHNPAEPHKVFLVPELLEMILLQTDTRTLLVSCQRVCRFWHEVIKDSSNLQVALFFEPLKQNETARMYRVPNPLLQDFVWPEYMRSNIQSRQHRWPGQWSRNLPRVNPKREEVFSRPEASWRRMLLQQPSQLRFTGNIKRKSARTNKICYIEFASSGKQPELARMEDITRLIQSGRLIPGRFPWTFPLTRSCEKIHKVPDVQLLDDLWGMYDAESASCFAKCSIIGLIQAVMLEVALLREHEN